MLNFPDLVIKISLVLQSVFQSEYFEVLVVF
jgi:hypothetical protein